MPVYEYVCADCRQRFEALRSMSQADEKIACEHCRSPRTARVLSVFFAASRDAEGAARPGASASSGCACGGACGCGHSHH